MQRKINKKSIAGLKPGDKPAWIYDTELKGFMVLCQTSGRKSFIVRYKTPAGSWRKKTLGQCAELSPDEAREMARNILAAARSGVDAVAEAERKRLAPTIEAVADRFMADHASRLKPGTRRNYEILFRRHILPKIGKLKVADMQRIDIQRFHDSMRDTPYNANRALEVLSKSLELCEVWGWRDDGTNPTRHVRAYRETHRQRTLTDAEVKRLWAVLDEYEQEQTVPAAQAVKLLLLTGCRLNEWLSAKWSSIDLDRGVLHLADSKTGARDVFLPPPAIEILAGLDRKSIYILPGTTGGPIGGIQRIWRKIKTRAGLDDVRLHDLRHTVGSLGHRAGLNQRQIADLLGHKQLQTTARYINSADEHKRETVNVWGGEINKILT